ncbi:hypothetical protein [Abyssibacter sp.]|uniref:hypothetical protein n=1 Tax=Abyssibacter sp. TaxID=2320200 RepID=UPI00306CD6B3|nr:hypothetical protein [Abyssibacter sp.]
MVFRMATSRSDPQRERTHARYAHALAGTLRSAQGSRKTAMATAPDQPSLSSQEPRGDAHEPERGHADIKALQLALRREQYKVESLSHENHRLQQELSSAQFTKSAALRDMKNLHQMDHDDLKSRMGDERRVAEDRLESVISEKLDIIATQIAQITDMQRKIGDADTRWQHLSDQLAMVHVALDEARAAARPLPPPSTRP